MGVGSVLNNMIFKRTSTFALAVAGGTFFFERTFDIATDYIFEKYNEGKLWKDVKQNYES